MKNDFKGAVGHKFKLSGNWGAASCEVLEIDPPKTLSYTWSAMGLESIVTFTLTKTGSGTHLRMDQAGFRPDQQQAYHGAQWGWNKFLTTLEQVVARED